MSQKNEILQDRTYVEIHMMQTIDGKATGNFWRKPDVWQGIKDYNSLIPNLHTQAFALGRVSMEENNEEKPDLSKYKTKEKLEHEDYVVPLEKGAKYYLASYDSKGTLLRDDIGNVVINDRYSKLNLNVKMTLKEMGFQIGDYFDINITSTSGKNS